MFTRKDCLQYRYDDGGRLDAGYKGAAGDCAVRAISIATGLPYQSVYDRINELSKNEPKSKRRQVRSNARTGVHRVTMDAFMSELGWQWVPTMKVGQGCTVRLRADELPSATIIVRLSKHYSAIVNGVVRDNHDPRRRGTRCVYGYWIQLEDTK